jgi:hypothetical protein
MSFFYETQKKNTKFDNEMKHSTRHIITIALIVNILSISSCYTIGKYESGVAYTQNYLLVSPVFVGGVIEKANKMTYDSTLSSMLEKNLTEITFKYRDIMQFSDTATAPEATKLQIAQLATYTTYAKSSMIATLPTPPLLDSLILSKGYRYGMAIYGYGFVRPVGNTIGWILAGTLTGALTGVSVTPNMNNCCLVQAIVVDAYEHRIISVKKGGPIDKNPSKNGVIEKTFLRTFKIKDKPLQHPNN